MQDLKTVNQIVDHTHLVVTRPNTINNSEDIQKFTVVDLKATFLCIPLSSGSWGPGGTLYI